MSDPNTLLSTLSQSSAAMVAIIGGFLVSRLVALSSEREGIKRQINAVKKRLKQIKDEYEPVHMYRLDNSKKTLQGSILEDVVKAGANEIDYEALVAENVPRGSSVEEMLPYAKELHAKVKRAYKDVLGTLNNDDRDDVELYDLKRRGLKVAEDDEDIYEEVLERIAKKLPPAHNPLMGIPNVRYRAVQPAWSHEIDARRLDDSIREEANLHSQLIGSEQELKHLTAELGKIAKPVGVMSAVVILAVLSVLGILLPVIIMAMEPRALSTAMTVLLIASFAVGLAGVLGYIVWYLRQLQAD